MSRVSTIVAIVLAALALTGRLGNTLGAEQLRVLPAGKMPNDKRLEPLKNLNGYFPFKPCSTPAQWEARAERLRRQLLVALGLWPMPSTTPHNAVIHGLVDRGQYTVEKVYLESFPGHFVAGNLYRPKGRTGRLPGVLCPHGHWRDGRFYEATPQEIEKEIAAGAEKHRVGGRYPLQARCVQLARMGCVVFHYDMVGYADSVQLPHRPGVREAMNTPENWGYFSPQAELRLQHMMGLQTYNSIRVLDWFSQLPDVDPQRIGVTGASGGGTQTFILCAIDPRPAVAFPAVMVSTAMQGGCTCENCCYLRIGTGNVEIAALFSPRPLGMTAADDWTKEMPTKGFPELQQHYKMLGAEGNVMLAALLQFKHNYNYPSRAAMYQWFNTHLKLGAATPVVEEDFEPLSRAEMSVWDDRHPRPKGGEDYERSLLRWITEDSEKQLQQLTPKDPPSLAEFRRIVGGAFEVLIGRTVPEPQQVHCASVGQAQLGKWRAETLLVRYLPDGEELPAIRLHSEKWNGRVVVWIDKIGKQGIFDDKGNLREPVQRILQSGASVVAVDLFGQGEFTADGKPMLRNRLNASEKDIKTHYAGYTYGYNYPLFSQRVHDILTVMAAVQKSGSKPQDIYIVGLGGAGHWVAAACAVAGSSIGGAAIDTAGFRFAGLTAIDDADFLPGSVKYGDLPAMIALSAPTPIWLVGEKEVPALVQAAYKSCGRPEAVRLYVGPAEETERSAVDWLLR
jgi:dienelactone hydrolase